MVECTKSPSRVPDSLSDTRSCRAGRAVFPVARRDDVESVDTKEVGDRLCADEWNGHTISDENDVMVINLKVERLDATLPAGGQRTGKHEFRATSQVDGNR